jgi:hypothetical protein
MCEDTSPEINLDHPANKPSIPPEPANAEAKPAPGRPFIEGYRLEIVDALDR